MKEAVEFLNSDEFKKSTGKVLAYPILYLFAYPVTTYSLLLGAIVFISIGIKA